MEQVSARLKMTTRQVQQIEADNYESMSSPAIARGFVRAYARLLNVDPEPLVAMFPAEQQQAMPSVQAKRTAQEPFVANRRPFKSNRSLPGKLIGMLAIALLIIGALIAWRSGLLPVNMPSFKKQVDSKQADGKDNSVKQSMPKEAPKKESSPASGVVSTELAPPKTVISEDAQPVAAPKQESIPAQQESALPKQEGMPANPATPAPATVAPATIDQGAPAAAKPDSANSASVKGKNLLVLRARENSWVQLMRAEDSNVLYERTLTPGQMETIEIKGPSTLTVGYAPGVEATLRGAPLGLKTAQNSTVARLNLK